ncbi:MAG: hypothetical protein ACPHL6_10835 [Rubripirellula sp.]
MYSPFLSWITFGWLLGLIFGFMFGKGDPQAPLIVSVLGALLGVVGSFTVLTVHQTGKLNAAKTDHHAIIGALLGTIIGGFMGSSSGLGKTMIAVFNPDLPERDWGAFFGATGGIILGAFFGACLASAIGLLLRLWRSRNTGASRYEASESEKP